MPQAKYRDVWVALEKECAELGIEMYTTYGSFKVAKHKWNRGHALKRKRPKAI